MDETDQDIYVSQLKEVFESCDTSGEGKLDHEQLALLCHKLQVDDHKDKLIAQLLGDSPLQRVDFEKFKEGFVLVLSNTVDGLEGTDYETEDDFSIASSHHDLAEEEPKYVKDGRRYGRRSKPDFTDTDNEIDLSDTDLSHSSPPPPSKTKRKKRHPVEATEESDDDIGKRIDEMAELDEIDQVETEELTSPEYRRNETFEAEGQMNASMGPFEANIMSPTEEDQVKAIWEEVGVGNSGFLNVNELAIVCTHIGMEEMNSEELGNLFEKLDSDGDGLVSFDEFVHGLFLHGGTLSTSQIMSPSVHALSATQKAKLRASVMGSSLEEPLLRTATPSIISRTSGAKLLSLLDKDNTGYASSEDICQQWESQGIHNPMEVLEALEIDMEAGKVNLQELSNALDHVLLTSGEENGVYQAAYTSYQAELKFVRTQMDTIKKERDKLKYDISEANQRNTKLVQEVDDRHVNMEKHMQAILQEAEKKYQEKITSLQADMASEGEVVVAQVASQRKRYEESIDQMKMEEIQYKEKLSISQMENEKLERELSELNEKYSETEKQNVRLHNEMVDYESLKSKLDMLESDEVQVSEKRVQVYEQNLKEYQTHNRELKDQIDELQQQVELYKQQLSERKVRRRGSRLHDPNKPGRTGSVLSDYAKPTVVKRGEHSSTEDSENDTSTSGSFRRRRQLPVVRKREGDGSSVDDEELVKANAANAKLQEELYTVKQEHKKEVEEIKGQHEKEIEIITEHNEKYIQELKDQQEIIKDNLKLQRDKKTEELKSQHKEFVSELKGQHEKHIQELKVQQENSIDKLKGQREKDVEELKAGLQEDYERQMESLKVMHGQEVDNLKSDHGMAVESLKESHQEEVGGLKRQHGVELEQRAEELQEMRINMENEVKDVEHRYKMEITDLEETYGGEKKRLEHLLEMERNEMVAGKEKALNEMLADIDKRHKREKNELIELHEKEKGELLQQFVKERIEIQERMEKEHREELDTRVAEARQSAEAARAELERKLEEQKAALDDSLVQEKSQMDVNYQQRYREMESQFEEEKSQMTIRHEQEKLDVSEGYQSRVSELEKQLWGVLEQGRDGLSGQLKADFEQLLEQHRQELEESLNTELQDIEDSLNAEKQKNQELLEAERREMYKGLEEERQALKRKYEDDLSDVTLDRETLEATIRNQMQNEFENNQNDEFERLRNQFQDEMEQLEIENAQLKEELEKVEVTTKNLRNQIKELEVERQENVRATRVQSLQSAPQMSTLDKAKLDMLEEEKATLRRDLKELNQKYLEVKTELSLSQSKHLRELQKLRELQGESSHKEAQTLRQQLVEKEHRLVAKEQRLEEVEAALKERTDQTKELLQNNREDYNTQLKEMKEEREEMEKKLQTTEALLDDNMDNLRDQLARSAKRDMLLKDLYVENACLQKSLEVAEKSRKNAENSLYSLLDKNKALNRLIHKICPIALQ